MTKLLLQTCQVCVIKRETGVLFDNPHPLGCSIRIRIDDPQ
jgi:hypothetical protein